MKKLFTVVAILMASVALWAQQPVITFEKTSHNFGDINEADGKVTTVFKFKNEGAEPLILSKVKASCGCTTPNWTKHPIEPGAEGEVTVTYNPNGRPGSFRKTITVTSNAATSQVQLKIEGRVIPKQAKPKDNYPVKMGKLSLKANTIALGDIKKGNLATQMLEYANQTKDTITVSLLIPAATYWQIAPTLETLLPGQTGKLAVALDAKACPLYGPVDEHMFVIINKEVKRTSEFRLNIHANIKEDFSKMTEEELLQAPIMETQHIIDFGTVAPGKKAKKTLSIKNVGHNTMMVRRVYCEENLLKITAPKSVRSGKKGDVRLELSTLGLEKGQYERKMLVITNDPKNAEMPVIVRWTVE